MASFHFDDERRDGLRGARDRDTSCTYDGSAARDAHHSMGDMCDQTIVFSVHASDLYVVPTSPMGIELRSRRLATTTRQDRRIYAAG